MALISQPSIINQIPKNLASFTQAQVDAWIESLQSTITDLTTEKRTRETNITNWQNQVAQLRRLIASNVDLQKAGGITTVPTNSNVTYTGILRAEATTFRVPISSSVLIDIPASDGSPYSNYVDLSRAPTAAEKTNDSVNGYHVLYTVDIEGYSTEYTLSAYYGMITLSRQDGRHTVRFQITRPKQGENNSAVVLKFKNGFGYAISKFASTGAWYMGVGRSTSKVEKTFPLFDLATESYIEAPPGGTPIHQFYLNDWAINSGAGYYGSNSSANDPNDVTNRITALNTDIQTAQSEINTLNGWLNTLNGEVARSRGFSPTTTSTSSTSTTSTTKAPESTTPTPSTTPSATAGSPVATQNPPVIPPSVIYNINKIRNIYNINNTVTNTYYNNISNINVNIGQTTPTRQLNPMPRINPVIRPINLTAFISSLIAASNARFR